MDKAQLIRGYDSYICNIQLELVLDTVVISNHPQVMQRMTAYSREAILAWLNDSSGRCPITREPLNIDQIQLSSIEMEVTMFLLTAEKHLILLGPDETIQKADIEKTLEKLRKEKATLVETARTNLEKLKNDERVDLPLDVIGSLIDFGVPGNYKKQNGYAQDLQVTPPVKTAIRVATPPERVLTPTKKKTKLPEAQRQESSKKETMKKGTILRGWEFVANKIISAFVIAKKGMSAFFSRIIAPYRRNNVERTRPVTKSKVEPVSSLPKAQQSTTYTLNIKLPNPPREQVSTIQEPPRKEVVVVRPPVSSTVQMFCGMEAHRQDRSDFVNQRRQRMEAEMQNPNSFVNQRLQRMAAERQDPNSWFNQQFRQMAEDRRDPNSFVNQQFRQMAAERRDPNSFVNQQFRQMAAERRDPNSFVNQQFRQMAADRRDPNSFVNQQFRQMAAERQDPNSFVNQQFRQMERERHHSNSFLSEGFHPMQRERQIPSRFHFQF